MRMLRTYVAWTVMLGAALASMAWAPSRAMAAKPLPAETKAETANLERLLPDDAEAVIVINFKQLLNSPLLKKGGALESLKDLLKKNDDAQKAIADLGLDPFTDIDAMISAQCGEGPDKGLIAVTGKFDVAKFDSKADAVAKEKKDAIKIHSVASGKDEYKVYEVSDLDQLIKFPAELAPFGPDASAVFVGVDKSAIVMSSSKEYVADALAKAAGKKKTELKSKEIQKLLAKVDAKQTLSLVVLASILTKGPLGEEPQAKDVLDKIENITGGITVNDGIKTQLVLAAKDSEAAKAVNKKVGEGLDEAQQLVGALADLRKELAPLLDVVKGVKVAAKDKAVTIDSDISGELLQTLAKSLSSVLKRK
jgi:hypothetical protein